MSKIVAVSLICLLAALWVPQAPAQVGDEEQQIFTKASKDKPAYRGFIISQSPRNIQLKGGKTAIPADEIEEIVFAVLPLEVRLKSYRPATNFEKEANTTKKEGERAKKLTEALAKYEEALPLLKEGQALAQAQIEYKIAYILYVQAREAVDDTAPKLKQAAAAKLKEFAGKHPQAWQLVRVLKMLAEAQIDLGQFKEAEQSYMQLAKADVADAVRQEAELEALMVTMRMKSEDDEAAVKAAAAAATKVRGLVDRLPKGVEKVRAQLRLGECLAKARDVPAAKTILNAVLDETKDKQLRARAYNTLGYGYWLNKQWQEARWEFLWVDTIYNHDKNEHAKALYYLEDIFARLNEGERASACRQALMDAQFAGTEYQRRPPLDGKSKEQPE